MIIYHNHYFIIQLKSIRNYNLTMPYNICMVCDFFYPNIGGVESHIYQLSQCLINRGHKVVVVTHSYGNRTGIRHLDGQLKVYYLPLRAFYKQCIFPTIFGSFPLIREIVIREEIDIIHGHSSFSTLAHEALYHAAVLRVRSVFTDHSLFGFADLSSILTNNVLKFSLNSINHTICVSNTARENTVLRSDRHPKHVSVIPNAIDASQFQPHPESRSEDKVVIVVMSRLVYRRGTDLLADIIPYICEKYPQVEFLIVSLAGVPWTLSYHLLTTLVGGDGDKRVLLEQIREQHSLHSRVKLLGMVKHENVREVMVKGHIFVNTSLTESFCITIVEAASCGLKVVTTNVGGVPEVLPPDMVKLALPNPESLAACLEEAIVDQQEGRGPSPWDFHNKIKDIYTWSDIARRTEIVYDNISKQDVITPKDRMNKLWSIGLVFSKVVIIILVMVMALNRFLDWWRPKASIDKCIYIYKPPACDVSSGSSNLLASDGREVRSPLRYNNSTNASAEAFTPPRRSSRIRQRVSAEKS